MGTSEKQPPRGADRDNDEPVLPEVTRDERGADWGEDERESRRDAEWYRRERPPHHE